MNEKNKIKIITWNVNSVKVRHSLIQELLIDKSPDFLLIQETKILPELFPEFHGYNSFASGEKGKNGVAVLAKKEHACQAVDFLHYTGRIQTIKFRDILLSSLYMFNGFSKASPKIEKINLYNHMHSQLENFSEKYILGGDFNILYKKNETTMPNPYEQDEIEVYKRFESLFLNTTPEDKEFITWWDYRTPLFWNKGFGLDRFFLKNLNKYENLQILKNYRHKERTSDHAPVEITIYI